MIIIVMFNPVNLYPVRLWFETVEVMLLRQSPLRYRLYDGELVCVPWWFP